MPNFWNVEWLNQNSQRSYPLSDEATKQDISGTITIPDSFLVGMYFPVHAGVDVDPEKFFLRWLLIDPSGFTIIIAYDDGTSSPPSVAAATINRAIHTENRSYAMTGSGDFDDSVGKVVIGTFEEIDQLPAGRFEFSPAGGQLDTDVIKPMIRGISSITLVNGPDRSVPLTGDIDLVAGDNMRLSPIIVEGEDPQIVFDAIEGEGLTEECECEEEAVAPPIRTINGIPPAVNSNFTLLADTCVEITPISNGLRIRDRCSEPCCGCEQLDPINAQLTRFGDNLTTLQNFVSRLTAETSAMSLTVLGSRIGDRGCLSCE